MGALDGILVVAIEQAVAAPLCTLRMVDAGARVIKIERDIGETARNYDNAVDGTSAYFAWLNRGKESAVLNLKHTTDHKLLRRMLSHADVLVQNLSPGAMDRMGLSIALLTKEFPHLITLSIVGYGQDTDYAHMKAYDMLIQAEAGLCAVTGTQDTPSKVGVSAADIATGSNSYSAVLEALMERAKTGNGKHIEISMFDCIADWMTVPLLHFEHQSHVTPRCGLSHGSIYPYRPFECRDGSIVIAIQTNDEWARLGRDVLGRPYLLSMAEFANNQDRVANRAALDAYLEPLFHNLTLADAIARCEGAGIAWAQFRDVGELSQHPALRRIDVRLANGASTNLPRPATLDTQPTRIDIPSLGQHTAKIREEFS